MRADEAQWQTSSERVADERRRTRMYEERGADRRGWGSLIKVCQGLSAENFPPSFFSYQFNTVLAGSRFTRVPLPLLALLTTHARHGLPHAHTCTRTRQNANMK